jgi:hypothetical protein
VSSTDDVNEPDEQTEQETPDATAETPPVEQPAQQSIKVDETSAHAAYANFCRVSSTPEELILDLGLNPQPYGTGEIPIKVSQRIIMNHFTAKRLLSALTMALQRHEQAFGVLETDVRKRVQTTT